MPIVDCPRSTRKGNSERQKDAGQKNVPPEACIFFCPTFFCPLMTDSSAELGDFPAFHIPANRSTTTGCVQNGSQRQKTTKSCFLLTNGTRPLSSVLVVWRLASGVDEKLDDVRCNRQFLKRQFPSGAAIPHCGTDRRIGPQRSRRNILMHQPHPLGASPPTPRGRFPSRPTALVVHSRFPEVRFRILSTHAAPPATDLPVSSLLEAQDVPESDGLQWRRNL